MTKPEQWAVMDADGFVRGSGSTADDAWNDSWINARFESEPETWPKRCESEGWTCTRGEWRPL